MIPYYAIPIYHLGPLPLDPWGTLVCIGFVVGLEVARARGIKVGLDVRDVVDGIIAMVGMGFIIGHLVDVLVYHPDKIEEHGAIILIQPWAGLSSFGGFLGAVMGALLFYKVIRKRPWLPHAEAVLYGFPFAWTFGRLGCTVAHDHIGQLTTFPLAIQYPCTLGGDPTFQIRHNLGLYEALWTMVIAVTFYVLGRKPRPTGFWVVLWCGMYAPVRFGLDFLRNHDLPQLSCDSRVLLHNALQDVRLTGLTPAQYGCLVMAGLGVWAWVWMRGQKEKQGATADALR